MTREDREEIVSFFKSRGERCLKIIPIRSHQETIDDFNCVVVTPSGKKETVLISLQRLSPPPKTLHSSYSL